MDILSIGLYGIPGQTRSNLIDANVFQDYDALVVNPSGLDTLYGTSIHPYQNRENQILTTEFASFVKRLNSDRREQVQGLLQKGGSIICLLEPFRVWRDFSKEQTITNYDWLFEYDEIERHFGDIHYGSGTTMDYINPSHPLFEYLSTKPPWSAYISKEECDESEWSTLASAFGTHLLSISQTVDKGNIIFLPNYYKTENGELLERCIRKLLGEKDVTPIPEWALSIVVPGQEQILKDLEIIDAEIDALQQKKEALLSENHILERWKWLLYETGKHRLEPAVRQAFILLGCKIEPQPDKDSDGKVVSEFGTAILEIEGAKETVKIDKISQLLRNIANFVAKEKTPVKGILVGNPFRLKELSDRPPESSQKRLFSTEVISNAELQNISVLLSTDLYEIVSLILENKLNEGDIESIRKRVFEGKGLIRLLLMK